MMKNWKAAVMIAAVTGLVMAGCGQQTAQETESEVIILDTEVKTTEAETTAAPESETAETEAAERETAEGGTGSGQETEISQGGDSTGSAGAEETYEDNFAVDSESAAAFASQIKEAVADRDLEKLAALTSFPVYVGIVENGTVETREDLLSLGADQVFTQELMDSVAAADENSLSPSMAGFVLSNESGRPNIIFGVTDGKLGITGINY